MSQMWPLTGQSSTATTSDAFPPDLLFPAKRTSKQEDAYLRINFFIYNWLGCHPFHSCSKSKCGQLKEQQRDRVHHTAMVSDSKPFPLEAMTAARSVCGTSWMHPTELRFFFWNAQSRFRVAPRWSSHIDSLKSIMCLSLKTRN